MVFGIYFKGYQDIEQQYLQFQEFYLLLKKKKRSFIE